MSEEEKRALQRIDLESKLPVGFKDLSEEEQQELIKKVAEQDIEIRGEFLRKRAQSEVAEKDLETGLHAVQRLDHERKIYSEHLKGKTGSGDYDLRIKGGDTRFIIPILVVVGVIILGIILIIALR